jgi:hypothetical protein
MSRSRYQPSFVVCRAVLRCALVGGFTFFEQRSAGGLSGATGQPLCALAVTAGLLLLALGGRQPPCSVGAINALHRSSYAAALWSASVTLALGLHDDDDSAGAPPLPPLLLLGWGALALLWCVPAECWGACRVWARTLRSALRLFRAPGLEQEQEKQEQVQPFTQMAAAAAAADPPAPRQRRNKRGGGGGSPPQPPPHPALRSGRHLGGARFHTGSRVQLVDKVLNPVQQRLYRKRLRKAEPALFAALGCVGKVHARY